jgi:hypothetical protein
MEAVVQLVFSDNMHLLAQYSQSGKAEALSAGKSMAHRFRLTQRGLEGSLYQQFSYAQVH